MNPQRPIKCDVYLYYKCSCGAERQITFTEVKLIGKYICESCGQLVKLQPMSGIKIVPQYTNVTPNQPTLMPAPKQSPNIIGVMTDRDIIAGLKNIGYTASQSKLAIAKVRESNKDCSNTETLFQLCINSLINGV